jgi:thiamine-phosphate pyrophosphorylase
MKPRIDWSLYVLTDEGGGHSHVEVARGAIAGGVTAVQFRDKQMSTRQQVEVAQTLQALAREAGVPFIVNDRVDVAQAVDADGVHVGQDDMPARVARRLIGPRRILGVSAETVEQAIQAEKDGADYVGAGTVFATGTKPDAGEPIGLEGLRAIAQAVNIPVVAIGGIDETNALSCMQAGAAGVAVVSAVAWAEDVAEAARRLRLRVLGPETRE